MSPILKILVLVEESIKDLKCLHRLFEYCRPYRILASERVTTASEEDVKEKIEKPIMANARGMYPWNVLLKIIGGGVPTGSLNPDPISV